MVEYLIFVIASYYQLSNMQSMKSLPIILFALSSLFETTLFGNAFPHHHAYPFVDFEKRSPTCLREYRISENMIIRATDSRNKGAIYMRSPTVQTREQCQEECCMMDKCNLAVFDDKNSTLCWLFDCGTPSVCLFTPHSEFTVIQFESLPSPIERTTLPSTVPDVKPSSAAPREECGQYRFACESGEPQCIAIYDVCDKVAHCEDRSDEIGCFSEYDTEKNESPQAPHLQAEHELHDVRNEKLSIDQNLPSKVASKQGRKNATKSSQAASSTGWAAPSAELVGPSASGGETFTRRKGLPPAYSGTDVWRQEPRVVPSPQQPPPGRPPAPAQQPPPLPQARQPASLLDPQSQFSKQYKAPRPVVAGQAATGYERAPDVPIYDPRQGSIVNRPVSSGQITNYQPTLSGPKPVPGYPGGASPIEDRMQPNIFPQRPISNLSPYSPRMPPVYQYPSRDNPYQSAPDSDFGYPVLDYSDYPLQYKQELSGGFGGDLVQAGDGRQPNAFKFSTAARPGSFLQAMETLGQPPGRQYRLRHPQADGPPPEALPTHKEASMAKSMSHGRPGGKTADDNSEDTDDTSDSHFSPGENTKTGFTKTGLKLTGPGASNNPFRVAASNESPRKDIGAAPAAVTLGPKPSGVTSPRPPPAPPSRPVVSTAATAQPQLQPGVRQAAISTVLPWNMSAILALCGGVIILAASTSFIVCQLRSCRARSKRKSVHVGDEDYLINGLYLQT